MFKPQHSRPFPKEKKESGMFLSPKEIECQSYKPLDGLNMAAIRNKITEFYSIRKQLLFRL